MKQITGVIAVLGVLLFTAANFNGCSKSSPVASASSTDQKYFGTIASGNDAATHDMATADQDALNDGAMYNIAERPMPPSIAKAADEHEMRPIKWGRYISDANRVVTKIDLVGDSVAVVHVQVTYTGTFVVYGMVNNAPDTVRKPYTETLHRLFRFIRVANSKDDDEPAFKWRLDAVSIMSGGTGSSAIAITQLQVVAPTGEVIAATDPDSYFMQISKRWMHDLPLWGINVQVTIMVTVHSMDADTDLVMLHYCPKNFGLHRSQLALVSQTGDSVKGYDRAYSAVFTVPGNDKKFAHLVISATTYGSLHSVASTDFASVVWSLPYTTSN